MAKEKTSKGSKNKGIIYTNIDANEENFIDFKLVGKDEDGYPQELLFAKCQYIRKVTRKTIDFYGNESVKEVIQVKALQEDRLKKSLKIEFECEESEYLRFFNFILIIRNFQISKYDKLLYENFQKIINGYYDMVPNEIGEIEDAKRKFILIEEEELVECFGVLANGKIYLPDDEIKLINEEEYETSEYYNPYLQFKKSVTNDISLDEQKKIFEVFYRYISNDKFSLILFAYSLISLFRPYLKFKFKASAFPHILFYSKKSGLGKTTMVEIILQTIIYGNNQDDLISSENVFADDSSLGRIKFEQFTTGASGYDELENISKNRLSILKEIGTKLLYQKNLGVKNSKPHKIIRAPFIFTSNGISGFISENLENRIIILNLENKEKYDNLDEDIKILKSDGNKLTSTIWNSLNEMIKLINVKNIDRHNANKEVMENGIRLVNYLCKKFDKPLFEYKKIKTFVENTEKVIATNNDQSINIINEIIKRETRVQDYDIYGLIMLCAKIEAYEKGIKEYQDFYIRLKGNEFNIEGNREFKQFRNELERLKKLYDTIKYKSDMLGIKIVLRDNDTFGFLFTQSFCNSISKYERTGRFTSIKSAESLRNIFNKENILYINSRGKGDLTGIKSYLGDNYTKSQNKNQYGLLWIPFNTEDDVKGYNAYVEETYEEFNKIANRIFEKEMQKVK